MRHIPRPALSHAAQYFRATGRCIAGGRWRGKSIDIKKQTETALVCKKAMFSIIFTIRCKYAAARRIYAISYSFTKHRPSPYQTGSGEARRGLSGNDIYKKYLSPSGRPTPQSAVGRPGGGRHE